MELTGGGDQNICPAGDGRDVKGACMAVDDSGVLMHQHHAHGASDDQRTSDDSCLSALDGDIEMVQDLHGRLGGAGRKTCLCISKNTGQRQICTAVDILGGIEHLPGLFIVQMFGKGTEEKDTVDGVVFVDTFECFVKDLLCDVGGEDNLFDGDAYGLGPFCCPALVGQVIGAFSHTEYTQGGCDTGFFQCLCVLLHLCGECVCDFFASEYFCHKQFLSFGDVNIIIRFREVQHLWQYPCGCLVSAADSGQHSVVDVVCPFRIF